MSTFLHELTEVFHRNIPNKYNATFVDGLTEIFNKIIPNKYNDI